MISWEVHEYQRRGKQMEGRLQGLAQLRWEDPHADRLAARLRKHENELTVFLWEDAVLAATHEPHSPMQESSRSTAINNTYKK